MKYLFCVFSGTGNTLRVAEAFAESLRAGGHGAEVRRILRDTELPAADGFDALVVGHPVHAFNAPTAVLSFLKKLPDGGGKPAYLLRVSGEPLRLNDAAGITPARILKRRGYAVKGEFSYVMPYNIIFRHSEGMAARMWQDAKLRIARDAAVMAGGGGARKKVGVFRRTVSFVLRIEHTAMPVLGHHFKATKKCVGCGACEKLCPRGNIAMKDGKPVFGKSCVGCMACAFGCPEDALKTSLLNGWRVNGRYRFDGEPAPDGEVCRYCRKSYLRYFHESESQSEERP